MKHDFKFLHGFPMKADHIPNPQNNASPRGMGEGGESIGKRGYIEQGSVNFSAALGMRAGLKPAPTGATGFAALFFALAASW